MSFVNDDSDYCVQPKQDCSLINSNVSYVAFSVGPIPCYIGIASNILSCIASVAIICVYMAWRDIRKNTAQAIVTFISIGDLFLAAGYLAGSVNLLVFMSYENHQSQLSANCDVFTNVCDIESFVVTCAIMSSYFWTIILALHFFLTIARERPDFSKTLMPFYHVFCWGLPVIIALPLLCVGKLAYAPFVGGIWCYAKFYRNSPPFARNESLVFVATQIPEIASFLVIIVFFLLTWIKIYKQVSVFSKFQIVNVWQ